MDNHQSLDELKEANRAAQAAEAESEAETTDELEATEEITEEQEDTEEGKTSEEETNSEDPEVEPWMQTDDDEDSGGLFPIAKHARLRKELKGRIKEKDTEIETLRAELQALKGTQKPVETPQDIGRIPVLEDFDYDRDKFDAAVKEWWGKMNAASVQQATQQAQQTTQQQQQTQRLKDSVDSHYQRAEQLIEKAKIAPELYQAADTSVRQMIENVRPGQGELVTDHLISVLGDGSEKVMFYVGRNQTKLAELQSMLINDRTGMQAIAYLGRLSAEIATPRQKQSTAPKPPKQVRGDGANKGGQSSAWKKKYEAAKTTQDSFNIRINAKRAGVDVSNW